MEPIALDWIADVLRAQPFGSLAGEATSVCTDTRRLLPGALFFALPGAESDGHKFVAQAFEKGAVAAVTSQEIVPPASQSRGEASGTLLRVPDTLQALGDLACAYRSRFDIPVVGITGSVGKTSTREMTATLLRAQGAALASERNLNTEVGVPLTLFQLNREHQFAVIEMGMRGLDQIDYLARIARPTVGAITNIGMAHVELLGSQEKIAQAKSELYTRLPVGGVAILPQEDAFQEALRARVPSGCRILTWAVHSEAHADVTVEAVPGADTGAHPYKVTIAGHVYRLHLAVPGAHHGRNAAVALAVALALNLPIPDAVRALEQWRGASGRMEIHTLPDGTIVFDDCYNAGVESMTAALDVLEAEARSGRGAVAVLGDLRELGDFTLEAHRKVGERAARAPLRLLVTVGELGKLIGETVARTRQAEEFPPLEQRHFEDTETAVAELPSLIRPGEAVLIKGSRALRMERIVAALTGKTEQAAHG